MLPLIIAVMFTFSFGSAFAAVATSEQKTTLATATTLATKQAQANFDLAMDELTGVAVGGFGSRLSRKSTKPST